MTAGIAIASWKAVERPLIAIAADTRVSRGQTVLNDASVKTLEIEERVALVWSGAAVPVFVAAEQTRTFLRAQLATEPSQRLGFFDTARLLGHFQNLASQRMEESSETIVAGYFRSGSPGLARIIIDVKNDEAFVSFKKCEQGGAIGFAVGPVEARRILLRGLEAAHREDRKLILTSLGLLEYMMRHEGGTFAGIGGQMSIGACDSSSGSFKWPALRVGERLYWRGIDVTENWSPGWDPPVTVDYDEAWCSGLDQIAPGLPSPDSGQGSAGSLTTLNINTVPGEELFRMHSDPEGF